MLHGFGLQCDVDILKLTTVHSSFIEKSMDLNSKNVAVILQCGHVGKLISYNWITRSKAHSNLVVH